MNLLSLDVFPNAVCNDGSPAGYWFKPSSTGSLTWIVHLMGGDWCFDAASCAARKTNNPEMTTSTVWHVNRTVGGMFDAADPRLADANWAYTGYCSSDGYSGNVGNASNAVGWHFRGRATVVAIFEDLMARQGLGAAPHTRVIFSGCSAGGRGVLFNAATIQGLLPRNVEHYTAVLDSPFWMDLLPLPPGKMSFAQETQAVYALANGSGSIDPACAAVYSGASGWKCLFGLYAVPSLRVPFLLHAYQYDLFQLNFDVGATPSTPAQLSYAEGFRNSTRAAASALVIPAGSAALLPACYKHCNLEDATIATISTNGWTLLDFLLTWGFDGSPAAPAFIMEDCSGFDCGHTCPPV